MTTLPSKSPAESCVTLTQIMGPTEANILGNVHGGVLMKICDEAGALAAIKHARRPVVTVAVDRMTFDEPVTLGHVVTFEARVTWVGRTSIETQIVVTAENPMTGDISLTNTAHFVYVALGETGRPTAVPSLALDTDDDRARHAAAERRQAVRLQLRREHDETGS